MIKKIIPIVFTLFVYIVNGQNPFYTDYNWDETPDYKNFPIDTNQDIIAFKDKFITEFYFTETDELVEFYLEHKILWLNSDERIEDYNRIYLPYNSSSEILVSKARVITNNGTILTLDDSKILTAKDDETKRTYKYFAMEGIEKGSFIEYFYILKKNPDYQGNRITMQSSYPIKNLEFDLYAPENLVFKYKSYNGLQEVTQDTTAIDKLHWTLRVPEVSKLENEDQSAYEAHKKYLVYKLETNTASNKQSISSYANVSKNIYNYIFKELQKDEENSISQLIEESNIALGKDDESKIRILENFLKKTFYVSNINSDEYKYIDPVIKNKAGNEVGLIKIYIAVLKKFNIPTQIVLTSNRFKSKFDENFEADNFLTDYLLYFPSVDKFTSAKEIASRLGFPPAEFTDNYGLFIKEVTLGNFKSGVGQIKYINPPQASETINNMIIDVSFNKEDIVKNNITYDLSYSGYYALFIQPFLDLATKEDLNKLYDEMIKNMNEDVTIIDKKVYNDKPALFGIKPFRLVSNVTSEAFTHKAGEKYLFKLGDLIGPQIEMYQEKQRQLPIDEEYLRSYERVINITIPNGFKIINLDDINIKKIHLQNGDEVLNFHSYFSLKNNILTVYANEFYKVNHIDNDAYENYRAVVNSAADFNKIVLIMEPK